MVDLSGVMDRRGFRGSPRESAVPYDSSPLDSPLDSSLDSLLLPFFAPNGPSS